MADSASNLPTHIAVIPDGNRRWARRQGVSTEEGHKAGYETLKRLAEVAFARGIPYLTAYSFSTENWGRAKSEVAVLMKLVKWVLTHEAQYFHRQNIRIRILGSRDDLDSSLVRSFSDVEELTKNNTYGTLNICFNYGGRQNLVAAVRRLARAGTAPEAIDEAAISANLDTAGIPDPDLIVRTSGEQRLSNYLLWESAYSELYFTQKLWPDFDEAELDRALVAYAERQRRYGRG